MCGNASWRCLDCNLETTLKIACQEKSPGAHITVKPWDKLIRSWIKNMQARPQWNLPVTWWRHWVDHKERELVVEQHRHTLCNCSTDITNQLYYLANMRPSIGNRDSILLSIVLISCKRINVNQPWVCCQSLDDSLVKKGLVILLVISLPEAPRHTHRYPGPSFPTTFSS